MICQPRGGDSRAAPRLPPDLAYLVSELRRDQYYSHGVLNSEGRTLLELLIRRLRSLGLDTGLIVKARRTGLRERVEALLGAVEDLWSEALGDEGH